MLHLWVFNHPKQCQPPTVCKQLLRLQLAATDSELVNLGHTLRLRLAGSLAHNSVGSRYRTLSGAGSVAYCLKQEGRGGGVNETRA
jgi:hypothetical protein